MRNHIKIFLVCFAIFYSALSLADSVSMANPASATVAVTDRSAPALQLALQSAFSEVMVKMSGNPNVMTLPAVQKASNNLTQWLQSYAYVEQPNANPQASSTLFLQVVFDDVGLQQLLDASTQKMALEKSSTPESTVTMIISGVKSVADYVQVIHVLRAKNDVTHLSVNDVQGDQVSLQIKIAGSNAQFQQLLSADNNFKLVATQLPSSQLQYYWMGNQA